MKKEIFKGRLFRHEKTMSKENKLITDESFQRTLPPPPPSQKYLYIPISVKQSTLGIIFKG